MEDFPIEKITVKKATLNGSSGDASIEIELEPFELDLDDYYESVNTSIRLDGINISVDPRELEGKEYRFPVNPDPGYIDGSIYFLAPIILWMWQIFLLVTFRQRALQSKLAQNGI